MRGLNYLVRLAIVLALTLAAITSSTGCALKAGPLQWTTPSESTTERAVADIVWPKRHAEPLVRIANELIAESGEEKPRGPRMPSEVARFLVSNPEDGYRGAFGDAVIVVMHEGDEQLPLSFNVLTTPYDDAEFDSVLAERDERWEYDRTPPKGEEELIAWMARQALKARLADTPVVSMLDCALFDAATDKPRGLVVHITSLARHSRYEVAVVQRLRREGWAVLEIGHPARMYEPFIYMITPTSDPAHHAPIIAQELDHRVAEWAIGVESALAFLADERPDLPQSPLVLAGFSLGAIVLPPVAARIQDRVDAAVIVAGGANLAQILANVVLTNGEEYAGFTIAYTEGVSRELRQQLNERYLEVSQLDPYHTAVALRDKPVLMLHAMFDRIVPADSGALLYNRLGRPARWRYFFGHLGLFWWLPNEAGDIADWLDEQLPREAR